MNERVNWSECPEPTLGMQEASEAARGPRSRDHDGVLSTPSPPYHPSLSLSLPRHVSLPIPLPLSLASSLPLSPALCLLLSLAFSLPLSLHTIDPLAHFLLFTFFFDSI